MVKSHVTDQNSLASKQVDLVQSKKTPESSRWGQLRSKEVWQMRFPSHKARTVFSKSLEVFEMPKGGSLCSYMLVQVCEKSEQ